MNEETIQTPLEIEAQAQATADAADDYSPENVDILARRGPAPTFALGPACTSATTGQQGPAITLVYELVYKQRRRIGWRVFCHNIHVRINDGRQPERYPTMAAVFPSTSIPKVGRPTLEVVLTTVGAGAKFDKRTYKTSAGLHGMGAKAVTRAFPTGTESRGPARGQGSSFRSMNAGPPHHGCQGTRLQARAIATGNQDHLPPRPGDFSTTPSFDYDTLGKSAA